MARDFVQLLDITLNVLGRAVVVVDHGQDSTDNDVVRLSTAYVNAEDSMDEGEQSIVEQGPEGRAETRLMNEAGLLCCDGRFVSRVLLRLRARRKVGFEQRLSLGSCKRPALGIAVSVEGGRLAEAGHRCG